MHQRGESIAYRLVNRILLWLFIHDTHAKAKRYADDGDRIQPADSRTLEFARQADLPVNRAVVSCRTCGHDRRFFHTGGGGSCEAQSLFGDPCSCREFDIRSTGLPEDPPDPAEFRVALTVPLIVAMVVVALFIVVVIVTGGTR